jgi:hypothetical protein
MRRRLSRLFLFLLLGAIVNVAMAWALAVFVSASTSSNVRSGISNRPWNETSTENWQLRRYERFGRTWMASTRQRTDIAPNDLWLIEMTKAQRRDWGIAADADPAALMPYWVQSADQSSSDGSWMLDSRLIDAAGWPFTCLWSERHGRLQVLSGASTWSSASFMPLLGGLDVGLPAWSAYETRDLPLRPIWPRMIANTLFYACLSWLVFAAPFAVRRRLRVHRGRCPFCAYPVGANFVCTECGQPIARS